jgi:hypothetical protein
MSNFVRTRSAAVLMEEARQQSERNRMAALRETRLAAELNGTRLSAAKRKITVATTQWIDDVRAMIVKNGQRLFRAEDLDQRVLQARHPECNTIDSSIRHNLQKLRDAGEVTFVDDNGLFIYRPFESATR